jgi:hypothetical protein
MFPIVLKTTNAAAPPPGQLYYEVAENGVFQVRDTPLYRAVTRVYGPVPGLLPGAEDLHIKFPRLPCALTGEVLAFFDEVYRCWEGEAIVILFYRADGREFRVVAPRQTIAGRRWYDGRWRADYAVRYDSAPRPEGFVRFGTIHSHADLHAYSSGPDCEDERYEDGLHIVFGDFHRRPVSVAAAFVANGVRFSIAPDDVLEDWKVPEHPVAPAWMAQVQREDRSTDSHAGYAGAAGTVAETGGQPNGVAGDGQGVAHGVETPAASAPAGASACNRREKS